MELLKSGPLVAGVVLKKDSPRGLAPKPKPPGRGALSIGPGAPEAAAPNRGWLALLPKSDPFGG